MSTRRLKTNLRLLELIENYSIVFLVEASELKDLCTLANVHLLAVQRSPMSKDCDNNSLNCSVFFPTDGDTYLFSLVVSN